MWVWLAGLGGLIVGFVGGLSLLQKLLRDKSRYDLLHDKDLRLKYGLFVWLIAGLSCYMAVWLYNYYFPSP